MPELPEVETTRRGILPQLQGQTVTDVLVHNAKLRWPVPRTLKRHLVQQSLLDIRRRGKYLIFDFSSGHMLVHLGMSGSLRIIQDITQANGPALTHDHIEWLFTERKILRLHDPRRFGSVHWTEKMPLQHWLLKDLGPEPLSGAFDGEYLYRCSRNRKTAIKNFIMSSHIVVGVGNIYANEALFLAGIHPKRAAQSISRQRYMDLAEAIKTVLNAAIQQGGTTLRDFVNSDGQPGYFRQQLNVYEREQQACRHCSRAIRREVIGQRASYYCTRCQR